MKLSRVVNPLVGLFLGLTVMSASAAVTNVDQMRFRVLLDDKEIGYHTFTIKSEGDATVVRTKAEFDVRILFVSAYSYVHENTETWKGSCLRRIDSLTDDNGKRFEVSGEKTKDAFQLVTLGSTQSLRTSCIMTFAYWNPGFLSQPRLLNAQTGEFTEVDTEALGKRRFESADGVIVADGYRVVSKDKELNIKVWYEEQSKRWVALESSVGSDKTLRYILTDESNQLSQVASKTRSRTSS